MTIQLFIIIAIVSFILILFFIWPRYSLRRLLSRKLLSDDKERYQQDRILWHHTKKCLHYLHKESKSLKKNPELADDILNRMKLLLPQNEILAQQRAYLHNISTLLHKKYSSYYAKQSSFSVKSHIAARALTNIFTILSSVKKRINQLDKTAEAQEKKIKYLLQIAHNFVVVRHAKQFRACIKIAKEFQNSNIKLLKAIHKTEKRLSDIERNFNSLGKQN